MASAAVSDKAADMNDWPDDWFRGRSAQDDPAEQAGSDKTVRMSGRSGQPGGGRPAPAAPSGRGAHDAPTSAWPQQPPPRSSAAAAPHADRPGDRMRAGSGIPRPPRAASGGRRWLRPRRITAIIAVIIALLLIFVVGMYFFLDSKLDRKNILVDYSGRPAAAGGTNWLITGSDSRQGLTTRQERRFSTGFDVSGQRSDTIMVFHIPSGGGAPLLISLPRDSWVPIPGFGYNKLNAAYAFGGPKLLARTVQDVTGLRIEHFMGIGFGGFVRVVNDIGGVRMCIRHALHDQASGLHLHKGCQTLGGAQALGYVRARHLYAGQDLQRIQDQRLFLRALLAKLTSAGTILNPLHSVPAATGLAGTLTVDQGTSLYQLVEAAFALRHPDTTTVPIANESYFVSGQDAVLWNSTAARQLFSDLNNGTKVPKSLITGSHQGT